MKVSKLHFECVHQIFLPKTVKNTLFYQLLAQVMTKYELQDENNSKKYTLPVGSKKSLARYIFASYKVSAFIWLMLADLR